MEDLQAEMELVVERLWWSKVEKSGMMSAFAVGEAWEKFSSEKEIVIIRSFRAIVLSLPIGSSSDREISIKGMENGRL